MSAQSSLPQSLIDSLDNICRSDISFWNYYKCSDSIVRKWIDLTISPFQEDHSNTKELCSAVLGKTLANSMELGTEEITDLLKSKSAVGLKEIADQYSDIKILREEDYTNTWGGGAGICEVIVLVRGKFVLQICQEGDW